MATELQRRLFSVAEYYRMLEAGILTEDDRVELIEGEVVAMTPIGSGHAACVDRLTRLLVEGCGGGAVVRVQNPIRLSESSEPQPDLALLEARPDFYASAHPRPAEVLLVIEVAESSVRTDREVKLPLYAAAGIREAWLVDLGARLVEVHRGPSPEGYRRIERVDRTGTLTPEALPQLSLETAAILG